MKRTKAYEDMNADELRVAEARCDDAVALMEIGVALAELGEQSDALRAYDRALAIEPDSACHYNRGNALHDLGRREDAVEAYHAALAIDSTYLKPMINLADELLGLERPADALEIAERALEVDPNSPDARLFATRAAIATDDLDRALGHWAMLAAFGFGPDAEELRAAIEVKRGQSDRLAEARAMLRCVAARPGFSDELKQELYDYAADLTDESTDKVEAALVHAKCRLNHREYGANTATFVQPALATGHPEAHTLLGYLLYRGQGVAKDLVASRREHLIAAERGVADSQFEPSVYFDAGIGGPADAQAARRWERRAADQYHPRALFNLGAAAGRAGDAKLAVGYYTKAARAGSFAAAERLATMYAAGAGLESDAMQGARWSQVAAALQSDGPLAAEDRTPLRLVHDLEFRLFAGAYNGVASQVADALDEGANVDARNELGYTALMLASMQGHTNVVDLLLERGATPSTAKPKTKRAKRKTPPRSKKAKRSCTAVQARSAGKQASLVAALLGGKPELVLSAGRTA